MVQHINKQPRGRSIPQKVWAWIGVIALAVAVIICFVGPFFNDAIILPLIFQLVAIASIIIGILQIDKRAFAFIPRSKKALLISIPTLFFVIILVVNAYNIFHHSATNTQSPQQNGCQASLNITGNNNSGSIIQCTGK